MAAAAAAYLQRVRGSRRGMLTPFPISSCVRPLPPSTSCHGMKIPRDLPCLSVVAVSDADTCVRLGLRSLRSPVLRSLGTRLAPQSTAATLSIHNRPPQTHPHMPAHRCPVGTLFHSRGTRWAGGRGMASGEKNIEVGRGMFLSTSMGSLRWAKMSGSWHVSFCASG